MLALNHTFSEKLSLGFHNVSNSPLFLTMILKSTHILYCEIILLISVLCMIMWRYDLEKIDNKIITLILRMSEDNFH